MVDLEENCLSVSLRMMLPRDLPITVNRLWERARAHKIWSDSACFEQGKEIKNGILLNLETQRKIMSSWFRNLLQTNEGFFFSICFLPNTNSAMSFSPFPTFSSMFPCSIKKKSYSLSKNEIIYMVYISPFNPYI